MSTPFLPPPGPGAMPAGPAQPPIPPAPPSRLRRLGAPPPTGWASVAGMLLMLLVAGLAMDVPRLAGVGPSGVSQTSFLAVVMVAAGLVGLLLARARLPAVPAHLLGAIIGVGVLLVCWAGAISGAASLSERLTDVNQAAVTLFDDVIVKRGRTEETIGFLVVVGAIAWTTGQFALYNLARRGIVAPGIVAIGTLVLVIALAPTVTEGALYGHLVVLTGLALLLVLRSNLAHQQASWRRRHIVGGRGVSQLFLRGGALVCAVALAGASLLAANVVAAPLRDAFDSADQRLLDLAEAIDSIFGGAGASSRPATGSYTDTAPITSSWSEDPTTVFTWSGTFDLPQYWRGAAYSRFIGNAWTRDRLSETGTNVPAGADLLGGSVDAVSGSAVGTRDVTYELVNRGLRGSVLLSPATPLSVDRETRVILDGPGGPFYQIDLTDQLDLEESATIQVRLPTRSRDGLTQSRLAAAGYDYGAAWPEAYTDIVPGTLGPEATLLAEKIANEDPDRTSPFDVALRMESFFAGVGAYAQDGWDFVYDTDLNGVCRPGEGVVDCLLRSKRGFCQQYATAMTLMLRSRSIPARYVQGFLPGQVMADGSWTVPMAAAHAWVEVYFPGAGWVRFDPTPGGQALEAFQQSTSNLPQGEPIPTPPPLDPDQPRPTPVFSDPPSPTPDPLAVTPPPDQPPPSDQAGLDLPLPLLLLLLLAVVTLVGAVVAIRRLRSVPGRDADLLYRAIAALAARVGYGPRPAQTPYEFTAVLTEAVPDARLDLEAVARAKVEATYAQRPPQGDALDALVASFQRVKRALVAMFVRGRRRR